MTQSLNPSCPTSPRVAEKVAGFTASCFSDKKRPEGFDY